jgi:hypothetical protein
MTILTNPSAILAALVGGGASLASAATPLPSWYGQPNSTRQGYTFNTSSLTPSVNLLENSYGTPIVTITLGGFNDGWQNPSNPIQLSGVASDGAWDLGTSGKISMQVPINSVPLAPGNFYLVDFQIYAVGYRNPTVLPGFDVTTYTPAGVTLSTGTVAVDTIFPGSSWDFRTWTGQLNGVSGNTVTFNLTSPANNTAVIDSYEVFTRFTLVPEPGGSVLLILPALGWISLRRRNHVESDLAR